MTDDEKAQACADAFKPLAEAAAKFLRPCHRCKAPTIRTSDWGATCEACDREISLMDSGA